MTVFGGIAKSALAKDLWVLSNANGQGGHACLDATQSNRGPNERRAHSAVYDSANNRMTVFGGVTTLGWANDVWVVASEAQALSVQILIMPGEDSRPND